MKAIKILLFAFLLTTISQSKICACSMYKVTADGKTMVGCNYDTWYTSPKIWFENAKKPNEYGVAINGARAVSTKRTAPNSGMNEVGLVFARLASYYPKQNNPFQNRIKISDEVDYLSDILHKCATIEEVKKYIEQYDHSTFIEGVFLYIDSTGKYMIVEPYNLIVGEDPYYILSNFCPSITDNETARKLNRYKNGEDFINIHEVKSTLSYCSALSDTMSVCRSRNGDGTLLTSLWDTKDKIVNLYFYHSYDSTVQFNLKEELAKGDHIINIPDQFSENKEYERLKSYITPFNTPKLKILLLILGGILTLLSFLLGLSVIINKNNNISLKSAILPSAMNLLLVTYLAILITKKYIYYFDAPFKHYSSDLISASSYIPFLLLLIFIPFTLFTIKIFKSVETKKWIKAILLFNNLIYVMLIVSFSYWGLYSIWN